MVSYQGFENLSGGLGGTEENAFATSAETQAQSPVVLPLAWFSQSNKHSHVHWWESNEGSCLCWFKRESFLLVMGECSLGVHINFCACYGCSLVGVNSVWRHHVYQRVCDCLYPLQALLGIGHTKLGSQSVGWGGLIMCFGRCDSSVCVVYTVQLCTTICVGQVFQVDQPEWTDMCMPNHNLWWAGIHLCLQYDMLWIMVSQGWKRW